MSGPRVPRIIHQTWKDTDVPDRWQPWARSWRERHPRWEHRLWTDSACREFLAEHYAWFLPVYDGYPEHIMRVDAVRYFLMDHFGGVYVDLDFECLRPVDDLVADGAVVVGIEPEEHTRLLLARQRGFEQVVGNAFLASPPGHPFWRHVQQELVGAHRLPGVLEVAGPFLLTRAVRRYRGDGVRVVPSELLYPAVSPHATQLFGEREPELGRAYAVHHWSGSWARNASWTPRPAVGTRLPFRASDGARPVIDGQVDLDAVRARRAADAPGVSCLMVTRDRVALARRAIACFQAQTYRNVELVVVDDSADDALRRHIADLDDARVRHHWLPEDGRTLGELRNVAVDLAAHPLVCQWDDDDLSDPERVEAQVAVLTAARADACLLSRERLWWPAERRLGVSAYRLWEGTLLCRKEKLPRYPAVAKGEDTAIMSRLALGGRVVAVDAPRLYTYVFHGANTHDDNHFAAHFEVATETWSGPDYHEQLAVLATRLPIDVEEIPDDGPRVAASFIAEPAPEPSLDRPKLLILTPVRDAARFVGRYLDNLARLDYPADRLSVALLEGDSADDTAALLRERLPDVRARRASLVQRDFGVAIPGDRWDTRVQRARRSALAKARNHLLAHALDDEEWVLWLDVDVTEWPADLPQRLLGAGKDIVAAHGVIEPGGSTFDLNTYVLARDAGYLDWSRWEVDGLLQPPKGFGRIYLDELRDHHLLRVDAVGGTALLVRADLHRDGLIFPSYPYRRLIETEGLAAMARDMGTACWAMPRLEVVHPPLGD